MEPSQISSPPGEGPWGRPGLTGSEESIKLIPKIRPSTTPGLPDYVQYVGHKALSLSAPGAENALWDFDFVASPRTRQSSFFRVAGRPMADHFLAFYNAAILAYGQTGSGKTHTMLGVLPGSLTPPSSSAQPRATGPLGTAGLADEMPREAGLIPRILDYIFHRIAADTFQADVNPTPLHNTHTQKHQAPLPPQAAPTPVSAAATATATALVAGEATAPVPAPSPPPLTSARSHLPSTPRPTEASTHSAAGGPHSGPMCATPPNTHRARSGRSGIPTPLGLPRLSQPLTPPPASPACLDEVMEHGGLQAQDGSSGDGSSGGGSDRAEEQGVGLGISRAGNEAATRQQGGYLQHQQQHAGPVHGSGSGPKQYLVKVSMLQIHQEVVTDLLNPRPARLQLRESMQGGVMVVGLSEVTVRSAAEALQLLRLGASHRSVAETASNTVSSRSHCILTLHMEAKDTLDTGVARIRRSRLQLVDLAGSERTSKGADYGSTRQREANAINKSLSTLCLVIARLSDRTRSQGPVPYRDSKLTFLLQDCLGGNAKTLIIANLNPSPICSSETNMTLGFALRAKRVRNRAVVNEDHQGDAVVLQSEVRRLREELSIFRTLHAEDAPPRGPQQLSAWRDQAAARASQLHTALQLNSELEEKLGVLEAAHNRLRMDHSALEEQCETQRCEISALEATVEQCEDELHELRARPTLEQMQALREEHGREYEALQRSHTSLLLEHHHLRQLLGAAAAVLTREVVAAGAGSGSGCGVSGGDNGSIPATTITPPGATNQHTYQTTHTTTHTSDLEHVLQQLLQHQQRYQQQEHPWFKSSGAGESLVRFAPGGGLEAVMEVVEESDEQDVLQGSGVRGIAGKAAAGHGPHIAPSLPYSGPSPVTPINDGDDVRDGDGVVVLSSGLLRASIGSGRTSSPRHTLSPRLQGCHHRVYGTGTWGGQGARRVRSSMGAVHFPAAAPLAGAVAATANCRRSVQLVEHRDTAALTPHMMVPAAGGDTAAATAGDDVEATPLDSSRSYCSAPPTYRRSYGGPLSVGGRHHHHRRTIAAVSGVQTARATADEQASPPRSLGARSVRVNPLFELRAGNMARLAPGAGDEATSGSARSSPGGISCYTDGLHGGIGGGSEVVIDTRDDQKMHHSAAEYGRQYDNVRHQQQQRRSMSSLAAGPAQSDSFMCVLPMPPNAAADHRAVAPPPAPLVLGVMSPASGCWTTAAGGEGYGSGSRYGRAAVSREEGGSEVYGDDAHGDDRHGGANSSGSYGGDPLDPNSSCELTPRDHESVYASGRVGQLSPSPCTAHGVGGSGTTRSGLRELKGFGTVPLRREKLVNVDGDDAGMEGDICFGSTTKVLVRQGGGGRRADLIAASGHMVEDERTPCSGRPQRQLPLSPALLRHHAVEMAAVADDVEGRVALLGGGSASLSAWRAAAAAAAAADGNGDERDVENDDLRSSPSCRDQGSGGGAAAMTSPYGGSAGGGGDMTPSICGADLELDSPSSLVMGGGCEEGDEGEGEVGMVQNTGCGIPEDEREEDDLNEDDEDGRGWLRRRAKTLLTPPSASTDVDQNTPLGEVSAAVKATATTTTPAAILGPSPTIGLQTGDNHQHQHRQDYQELQKRRLPNHQQNQQHLLRTSASGSTGNVLSSSTPMRPPASRSIVGAENTSPLGDRLQLQPAASRELLLSQTSVTSFSVGHGSAAGGGGADGYRSSISGVMAPLPPGPQLLPQSTTSVPSAILRLGVFGIGNLGMENRYSVGSPSVLTGATGTTTAAGTVLSYDTSAATVQPRYVRPQRPPHPRAAACSITSAALIASFDGSCLSVRSGRDGGGGSTCSSPGQGGSGGVRERGMLSTTGMLSGSGEVRQQAALLAENEAQLEAELARRLEAEAQLRRELQAAIAEAHQAGVQMRVLVDVNTSLVDDLAQRDEQLRCLEQEMARLNERDQHAEMLEAQLQDTRHQLQALEREVMKIGVLSGAVMASGMDGAVGMDVEGRGGGLTARQQPSQQHQGLGGLEGEANGVGGVGKIRHAVGLDDPAAKASGAMGEEEAAAGGCKERDWTHLLTLSPSAHEAAISHEFPDPPSPMSTPPSFVTTMTANATAHDSATAHDTTNLTTTNSMTPTGPVDNAATTTATTTYNVPTTASTPTINSTTAVATFYPTNTTTTNTIDPTASASAIGSSTPAKTGPMTATNNTSLAAQLELRDAQLAALQNRTQELQDRAAELEAQSHELAVALEAAVDERENKLAELREQTTRLTSGLQEQLWAREAALSEAQAAAGQMESALRATAAEAGRLRGQVAEESARREAAVMELRAVEYREDMLMNKLRTLEMKFLHREEEVAALRRELAAAADQVAGMRAAAVAAQVEAASARQTAAALQDQLTDARRSISSLGVPGSTLSGGDGMSGSGGAGAGGGAGSGSGGLGLAAQPSGPHPGNGMLKSQQHSRSLHPHARQFHQNQQQQQHQQMLLQPPFTQSHSGMLPHPAHQHPHHHPQHQHQQHPHHQHQQLHPFQHNNHNQQHLHHLQQQHQQHYHQQYTLHCSGFSPRSAAAGGGGGSSSTGGGSSIAPPIPLHGSWVGPPLQDSARSDGGSEAYFQPPGWVPLDSGRDSNGPRDMQPQQHHSYPGGGGGGGGGGMVGLRGRLSSRGMMSSSVVYPAMPGMRGGGGHPYARSSTISRCHSSNLGTSREHHVGSGGSGGGGFSAGGGLSGGSGCGGGGGNGSAKGTWVQRFLCRRGSSSDGTSGGHQVAAILTPAKWRPKGMTGIVLRQWVPSQAKNQRRAG